MELWQTAGVVFFVYVILMVRIRPPGPDRRPSGAF